MKIAIAGIISKKINANAQGGTEYFIYQLVENLVKRGHHVTIFTSSDSQTSAKLVSVCSSKESSGIIEGGVDTRIPYQLLQSMKIAQQSGQFDIIHNNYFDSFFLTAFSPWIACPIVTTVHNDFWQFPNLHTVLTQFHRPQKDNLIFTSIKAKKLAGDPGDSEVIHNGVDISVYKFADLNRTESILWLSRLTPKKGAKEAIQVALASGKRLNLISAPLTTPQQKLYFDEFVVPYLSGQITLTGSVTLEEKVALYQAAKLFLFPIQWEEPFGLVMTEALSCGTPVVAFARGAVPEIIKDGQTGFIVNPSDTDIRGDWIVKKTGIEGLKEAVQRIYALPEEQYAAMRRACREHVEKNFTIEKMVDGYERVYQQILQNVSR